MADENKIGTPEDESNIDQINSFVTSSKDTQSKIEKNPEVVAELKSEETEELKEKDEKTASRPIKQLPIKSVKHTIKVKKHEENKKAEEKKKEKEEVRKEAIENKKKEEKHEEEKIKHKPIVKTVKLAHSKKPEVKPEPKKEVKQKIEEPKKDLKEVLKVKKESNVKYTKTVKNTKNIKKSVKEDKMKSHKEHKEHKTKFHFSKNTLLWVGIGVLAAVLVIALIILLPLNKQQPAVTNQTSNTVAATVNGEPIYLQTVQKEFDNLNPMIKSMYTIESILNKSIDDLLLYQEAQNKGLKASAERVKAEIDNIKIQNQLTDTAFEKALAEQKMTVKDAEKIIEKTLMVRELLNDTILKNIVITEGEISQYYNANLDKFEVPEKVTAQHILVTISENVTDEMAKAKIDKIEKELTDTNFCELVTKYSEDPGSLLTCGNYTFGRGEMVTEFENPSFDMNIGEHTIVKTQFGYHLIKKLDSIPAKTLSLEEVKDEIESVLHDDTAQKSFDAFMTELRTKATIVNYLTKVDSNESTAEVVAKTGTQITNNEPATASLDDFAKCITDNGAVFYGSYSCSHCIDQKSMFGDSLQYINYVECTVEGQPSIQTEACTKMGISGYPTWIVNGKSYPGKQSLARLADLTGCTTPQ